MYNEIDLNFRRNVKKFKENFNINVFFTDFNECKYE